MTVAVYISLGSNIKPELHLRSALAALQLHFGEVACSPVYRSKAVGFAGADFLNLVARVNTEMPVFIIQPLLHMIEEMNGRQREDERFGPRTLDLDLLLYGDQVINAEGLEIPRAEILSQAFVLKPLSDIAPDTVHPLTQQSFAQLWQEFPQQSQVLEAVEVELA